MPLVAVLTADLSLRETLSVLLEYECHLDVVPDATTLARRPIPLVAVVAHEAPAALAAAVAGAWPSVPVVLVDARRASAAAAPIPEAGSAEVVALDPYAIRHAVLKHLRRNSDDSLRACTAAIAAALSGDWTPRLARWRRTTAESCQLSTDLTVLIEQSDLLQPFLDRPQRSRDSLEFVAALSMALQERLLRTGCTVSFADKRAANGAHGPLALAPFIASLLATRIRSQRPETSVKAVATDSSLRISFDVGDAGEGAFVSLPLVLAGLALDACSWRVLVRSGGPTEEITLCPFGASDAMDMLES